MVGTSSSGVKAQWTSEQRHELQRLETSDRRRNKKRDYKKIAAAIQLRHGRTGRNAWPTPNACERHVKTMESNRKKYKWSDYVKKDKKVRKLAAKPKVGLTPKRKAQPAAEPKEPTAKPTPEPTLSREHLERSGGFWSSIYISYSVARAFLAQTFWVPDALNTTLQHHPKR